MIAFNCFSDLKPIILCLFWMSGVSLLIFKVPPNLHGCPPGKNLHGRFFRGNSHKLIINRKVMKCKSNTTIFCFANCFLKAVEAFNTKTIDWSSTIEKFAKRVALGVAKRKLVKIKKNRRHSFVPGLSVYVLANFQGKEESSRKTSATFRVLKIYKHATPSYRDMSSQKAASQWNNRTPCDAVTVSKVEFRGKATVLQSHFTRTRFRPAVNNYWQNRRKATCNKIKKN